MVIAIEIQDVIAGADLRLLGGRVWRDGLDDGERALSGHLGAGRPVDGLEVGVDVNGRYIEAEGLGDGSGGVRVEVAGGEGEQHDLLAVVPRKGIGVLGGLVGMVLIGGEGERCRLLENTQVHWKHRKKKKEEGERLILSVLPRRGAIGSHLSNRCLIMTLLLRITWESPC